MPSKFESLRLLDDRRFGFQTLNSTATCRIQLFEQPDGGIIVVATQSMSAEGTSLVNAQRQVMDAVAGKLLNGSPPDRWVQVLLVASAPTADEGEGACVIQDVVANPGDPESFAWAELTLDELTQAVGGPVDITRGDQFTPTPEPVTPPDRFAVVPVLLLPTPQPFRARECMKPATRAKWALTAIRRPGTGCSRIGCTYHGVDWHEASRQAVRALREVKRAQPTEQAPAAREWLAATCTGDTLMAAESLFSDAIALPDHWWKRPTEFSNGQHRARAMLDQGVPFTVVRARPRRGSAG